MSLRYADKLSDGDITQLILTLEPTMFEMEIHRSSDEIQVKARVSIEDVDGEIEAVSFFTFDDYSFECSDYDADEHQYELRKLLLEKCGPQYAIDYLLER